MSVRVKVLLRTGRDPWTGRDLSLWRVFCHECGGTVAPLGCSTHSEALARGADHVRALHPPRTG